jgi:hypothetical protein
MEVPWDRARKLRSTIQEQGIDKMPGGKRQPNSGRFWRWKRDGVIWNFLIEARTTEANSYRIEAKEWLSIRKEALRTLSGLKPAMKIQIQDLNLIVMEESDFEAIMVKMLELENEIEEE